MDSKPVPGGWSVDPRGAGTYRFFVTDRKSNAFLADGWMHTEATGRAFVPFDRVHLPPAGRPGRVDGHAPSVALTRTLGLVPAALHPGAEPFSAARGDDLRAALAKTAAGSVGDLRSAAALERPVRSRAPLREVAAGRPFQARVVCIFGGSRDVPRRAASRRCPSISIARTMRRDLSRCAALEDAEQQRKSGDDDVAGRIVIELQVVEGPRSRSPSA